ncbi:hypothetical protein LEP1GSC151_0582 [Leptospira interrogans serovar Grippotyphosa str. LT2186]|uniref:Uncharacterized protein n=1 Tax=Leptospira interrogans serovar Grippotyphosa str. LT2186 TaxID=1001599 RepID=M3H5E5_LEPIR|nr:hypothetical protein LEP1GSC151_0582 [Leptospira interrogans serovar Grippotyphosa str. LT2186]
MTDSSDGSDKEKNFRIPDNKLKLNKNKNDTLKKKIRHNVSYKISQLFYSQIVILC